MKNPACKESVQSSAFRRQHAVVRVSAIMYILPGYRGTYIWGVCTFGALQPAANFSNKRRGTYFRRGTYLRGLTAFRYFESVGTLIVMTDRFVQLLSKSALSVL